MGVLCFVARSAVRKRQRAAALQNLSELAKRLGLRQPSAAFWLITLAVIGFAGTISYAAEPEFRGRVVCLLEETNRVELPAKHEHIYGFKTQDGAYYTLQRTRLSEALFMDERLRKKDLLLKGTVLPKTQTLDVKHIKSIHKGVIHDLYYYCDVCAIDFVSPVECVCCRGPVELIEKPASGTR